MKNQSKVFEIVESKPVPAMTLLTYFINGEKVATQSFMQGKWLLNCLTDKFSKPEIIAIH